MNGTAGKKLSTHENLLRPDNPAISEPTPSLRRWVLQQKQLMQLPQVGKLHSKVITQGNGHHALQSARATEQTSLVQKFAFRTISAGWSAAAGEAPSWGA